MNVNVYAVISDRFGDSSVVRIYWKRRGAQHYIDRVVSEYDSQFLSVERFHVYQTPKRAMVRRRRRK